jgi:hypothetical protein
MEHGYDASQKLTKKIIYLLILILILIIYS